MAAVASSSTLVPRQRSRRDVFKPKFPLDPFAGASAAVLGEPWFLKIDALLSATALQRRNVIFVLGAPTLKELAPLLQSRHFAKSLVILATHNPPDIPGIVIPSVRILRLSAPLALEHAGAVQFVNILEWAERVARTWRKHGGGGVVELHEDADGHGELAPPSMSRFGSQSTPTSPGSSSTFLTAESALGSSPPSSSRPSSFAGSFFPRRGRTSLPPPDPSQRPFDVFINFMPEKISDKALLKNSILVTTISRPFLTSSVHPSAPTLRSRTSSSASIRLRPQSIFGAFSRSSTSVYIPPTPPYQSGESLSLAQMMPAPPGRALLIHLLPASASRAPPVARRRLVESMESFLLSFALQASPAQSQAPAFDSLQRARPYVMQAITFCEPVGCEPAVADYGDWTVADVVLSGALDADAPAAPSTITISASVGALPSKSSRRAWVASAADVVIMPSSDDPATPASGENAKFQAPATDLGHRAFNKNRSSSAPLLSSEWKPSPVLHSRPLSHSALSQPLKGSKDTNLPSLPPGGLPTPPHSEEDSNSINLDGDTSGDHADVTASTISISTSDGANVDGNGKIANANDGSAKKPRWKFWRMLGHGHHGSSHGHSVQPATVKA